MGRHTKMNQITTPELLAQVNPDNISLKREFLSYLRATQKSDGTVSAYDSDLNIFFVWVLQNAKNKRFADVTKRDIIAFQNWLIYENGNSPARVRRLKAAISSLSNYCENILSDDDPEFEGFRSIVKKIENPPLRTVREKTVLSEDDLNYILARLTSAKKYEVACFVALAAYGGRRKAEICRFRTDDFSSDKLLFGGSLYRSAPIKTKGRGGGKYIPCYTLAKPFRPYLERWMDERRRLGIESEWLFPASDNPKEQLQVSTVNGWMDMISRMTDIQLYAHSLRHYFITMLSSRGLPDNVIQEIVGWSDISMVNVYRDTTSEETIGMYFDENGIIAREKTGLADL